MPSKPDIFISIDIEADGQIPGINSMLSFGAAAFDGVSEIPLESFQANLETLPGAVGDIETMKWWGTQPAAWAACRLDTKDPTIVMPEFSAWLRGLPGNPVFVGFPITFDFMFLYWYVMAFGGKDGQSISASGEQRPISFSGIDIKTLAWAKLGGSYSKAVKRNWPRTWFVQNHVHNHVALDDAIEQGISFTRILNHRSV